MKAKLNVKHDYITLTVVQHDGLRANFTVSHRGEKVSTSGLWTKETFGAVANAFLKKVKNPAGSYGAIMEDVRVIADKATDFQDFTAKLVA